MIPGAFTYYRAESVQDAVQRISVNPNAKILAGGHSLVPAMKLRLALPDELVDITGLDDLKGVTIGETVRIGAMVTYNELLDNEALADVLPIFSAAIPQIGDEQVRSHGTFGGSLAHADPAADLTAVFLALGGDVIAAGPDGERRIPSEEYFIDLWTTALAPDEIVTAVEVNIPTGNPPMTYVKHRHPASGYAVVGLAIVLAEGDPKIVLTGATSKPEHLTAAEQALTGGTSTEAVSSAAEHATDGVTINGDMYADEEFRSHLVRVMLRNALTELVGQPA